MEGLQRDTRKLFGLIDVLIILIVYGFQTCKTAPSKYVLFIGFGLYLNKAVFKRDVRNIEIKMYISILIQTNKLF